MPAIEVLRAKLLPGSDLKDPNNSIAKIIEESVQTASKQDGVTQVHFGTWIDDPSILQVIIDWESLEKYTAFTKSEIYPAFAQKIFSVTTGSQDAQLVHVGFEPLSGLERALSAPLTSIATLGFENGQIPPDFESNAQKVFDNIRAAGLRNDIIGDSFGFTQQEIEVGGVRGRCAIVIAGWASKEDFDRIHALPVFRANGKDMRLGVSYEETHYVKFTKVERS